MLVPMRDLLDKATIEGYGVVAPNVINECTARVCIEAAEELHAPLILDVGYVFHPDLVFLGRMLNMGDSRFPGAHHHLRQIRLEVLQKKVGM